MMAAVLVSSRSLSQVTRSYDDRRAGLKPMA